PLVINRHRHNTGPTSNTDTYMNLLISACLLGEPVRYDGRDNHNTAEHLHDVLQSLKEQGRLIAVCPEVAGGLGIPRAAAEIIGGDGHDVLAGQARVIDNTGQDVSAEFI